ncbi:2-hydroxyacid dehydrogenase [Klebsiella variicola]
MSIRPKIFMSCPLFLEAKVLFEDDFDVIYPDAQSGISNMQQLAKLKGIQGAVVSISDNIDAEVLASISPTLNVIATYSVGTSHIDLGNAVIRGISVLNTPDVLSESCADTAMLLMLGAARRAVEAVELIRGGGWTGWQPDQLLGKDVWGQRLGIYGMGRIGQAVARRAMGFGMAIHYHNRRQLPSSEEGKAQYHPTLEQLMQQSDYFCIACPPSLENKGIIDQTRLALLPDNAVVVNISRGDIIQDDALIESLASGRLAAAGLDVFAKEPDIHPAYRTEKNVFGLPHIGSSTLATRLHMATLLRDGMKSLLFEGTQPENLVRYLSKEV